MKTKSQTPCNMQTNRVCFCCSSFPLFPGISIRSFCRLGFCKVFPSFPGCNLIRGEVWVCFYKSGCIDMLRHSEDRYSGSKWGYVFSLKLEFIIIEEYIKRITYKNTLLRLRLALLSRLYHDFSIHNFDFLHKVTFDHKPLCLSGSKNNLKAGNNARNYTRRDMWKRKIYTNVNSQLHPQCS